MVIPIHLVSNPNSDLFNQHFSFFFSPAPIPHFLIVSSFDAPFLVLQFCLIGCPSTQHVHEYNYFISSLWVNGLSSACSLAQRLRWWGHNERLHVFTDYILYFLSTFMGRGRLKSAPHFKSYHQACCSTCRPFPSFQVRLFFLHIYCVTFTWTCNVHQPSLHTTTFTSS